MSDDLDFTGVSTDELRAMYSTAARIANACMAEGKRRADEAQAQLEADGLRRCLGSTAVTVTHETRELDGSLTETAQATSCSHSSVNHFQETPEECAFDECRDCGKETASYPFGGGNPHLAAPVAATPLHPVTEAGMYRQDGVIYKVQKAVHGSGHLYAKRLVVDDVAHGEEDGHLHGVVRFEFAQGMIRKLYAEDRMTLEDAKAFGALYGTCCVCGKTLTNETSIAAGIGPVCGGRI